jgi:hypothetical protein
MWGGTASDTCMITLAGRAAKLLCEVVGVRVCGLAKRVRIESEEHKLCRSLCFRGGLRGKRKRNCGWE